MTPRVSPFEELGDNQDEQDTQPSSTSWRAHYDSEGHWTACFAECPDWAQTSITKQLKKQLWSYGSFPGIKFANKLQLRDQVAKAFMRGRYEARRSTKVTWSGCLDTLMEASKRDKEEIISSYDGRELTKVAWSGKATTIKDSQGAIVALRIAVPEFYIQVLEDTDGSLPARPPKSSERGAHIKRHYALWADYADHPYMSAQFLEDGEAACAWLKSNTPLFR